MKRHAPITHIGYLVSDLEEAVNYWSTMLGAGPFFIITNIQFDVLTHPQRTGRFRPFGRFGTVGFHRHRADADSR